MIKFLAMATDWTLADGGTIGLARAYHILSTYRPTLDGDVDKWICETCHMAQHYSPGEISEILGDDVVIDYDAISDYVSVAPTNMTPDQIDVLVAVIDDWPAGEIPFSHSPCDTCCSSLYGSRYPVMWSPTTQQ